MSPVNSLIQYVNRQGWDAEIYYAFVILAFFVQILFLLGYRKNYGISAPKAVLSMCIVYPLGYVLCLFIAWVESGFQYWGTMNIVRLYAFFPLIALLAGKILKIPSRTVIDFLAPGMALESAVAHSACPFEGCCQGYPCSWGVWNPVTDSLLFPIQWLECAVAFLIFLGLIHYAKRTQFKATGRVYIWLLIAFGSTRFFLEFLRDNSKVILGISNLALHAAFMTVVGLVWYWVMLHYEEKARYEAKKRSSYRGHKKR